MLEITLLFAAFYTVCTILMFSVLFVCVCALVLYSPKPVQMCVDG